jgi:hypothetical protein
MRLRSISEPLQSRPLPDYSCLGLATPQTLLTHSGVRRETGEE